MATLTTLELLSPPEDVAREAQAQIAMALQQDVFNQPELMAAACTTNFAAQSVGISAGFAAPSFDVSSGFNSLSSGTGRSLSDGLADPQFTKRAYEDIRALAASFRSARASFKMVSSVVWEIDRMSQGPFTGLFGASSNPRGGELSAHWSDISKHFERALQASIQVAPMAMSSLNGVKDLLGSASGLRRGDLKARLQAFIVDLKQKETWALDVKNMFQNMVDRLRTFWVNVENALKNPWVQFARMHVVQNLGARIVDLTGQLEGLQRNLGALNSAALAEVATGGIGAAMTIYQLCPSAFFLIMNGAFGFGVGKLLNSTVQQIETVKAQIESARREMTREQQHQAIMQDPKTYLNEVALKLDTVVNIWQTINLDMHALYTDLSTNVSDDAPVTVFFLTKMRVAKEIYEKLAWLLEIYVEQMRSL